MALTHEDIHQLIKEPSSRVRAQIAQKVARSYNFSSFTTKANKIAIDIFRLLLQDTSRHVREALAEELRHNPNTPRDVVLALATDDYDVAEAILLDSPVLTESDLIELVQAESNTRKLIAIARRKQISRRLSAALIETRKPNVITTLMHNLGAQISESSYAFVIQEFSQDQSVLEALVCRGDLSLTLAETLYSMVSDHLRKAMTRRHLIPRSLIDTTQQDVRESAILRFLSPWMTDEDVLALVEQMHSRGRLTDSIILRALCLGEICFFEASIAKRVHIPLSNARKLLRDPGESGFFAIYRSSKLPEEQREAVRLMLKLVQEQVRHNRHRLPGYASQLLQEIRAHNYDSCVSGMNDLMAFLQRPAQHVPVH